MKNQTGNFLSKFPSATAECSHKDHMVHFLYNILTSFKSSKTSQREESEVYATQRGKLWAVPLQVTDMLFPNMYRSRQTTMLLSVQPQINIFQPFPQLST